VAPVDSVKIASCIMSREDDTKNLVKIAVVTLHLKTTKKPVEITSCIMSRQHKKLFKIFLKKCKKKEFTNIDLAYMK
jgi:hypothetical protein